MGWQIGLMCARAGYTVRQTDLRPEALENARERQRATLEEWQARGELGRLKATGEAPEAVMGRITYHTTLAEAAGDADFAIEAATEQLAV